MVQFLGTNLARRSRASTMPYQRIIIRVEIEDLLNGRTDVSVERETYNLQTIEHEAAKTARKAVTGLMQA